MHPAIISGMSKSRLTCNFLSDLRIAQLTERFVIFLFRRSSSCCNSHYDLAHNDFLSVPSGSTMVLSPQIPTSRQKTSIGSFHAILQSRTPSPYLPRTSCGLGHSQRLEGVRSGALSANPDGGTRSVLLCRTPSSFNRRLRVQHLIDVRQLGVDEP